MRLPSLILALSLIATASVAHADENEAPPHDRAMRSPALLGTGITFATLGALAVPVGAFILLIPKSQPECFGQGPCGSVDYTSRDWAGVGFLAGGLALVGASIPMIVVGAHRVPVTLSSGPLGSAGLTLQARF